MARDSEVHLRTLGGSELRRIAEIDRTERIDAYYVQRDAELELRVEDRSSPPWAIDGTGEHSVAGVRRVLEEWTAAGATALGAFDGERLVGVGVVLPYLRPRIAQLAFLYVTDGCRGRGIGSTMTARLEQIASAEGATSIVVSATPSRNTVDFYLARGYEPTADPVPELVELEPEDVHMRKAL